ncbi:hypothetical protein C8R31_102655 [Nitrosospira sp. Nsp2]|nr:hypothetical protein C8R31_102655 [Nitrosospira sp. Nsp2]
MSKCVQRSRSESGISRDVRGIYGADAWINAEVSAVRVLFIIR